MESGEKHKSGNYGEKVASEFLENLGYEIIKRNYRFGHGEIDIIAKDGDILVFVEVKYRKNLEYGPPESAISKVKQKQIKKIAESYLYENNFVDQNCRMDVIAILHLKDTKPEINHIINAF